VSDFLGRMAEQALRQAPVVEPLVRSRYEPAHTLVSEETGAPPVTAPSLAPPSSGPADVRALEPTALAAAPPPARSRREPAVQPPEAVEETTALGAPGVAPASAAARRERAQEAQGRATTRAVSSPRDGEAESGTPVRAPPPPADVEPLDVEETLTAVPVATRRHDHTDDADPAARPAAPRRDGPGADHGVRASEDLVPEAVRELARQTGTERGDLGVSRLSEVAQPLVARRAQASVPEPEPVRVTIGRVEVVAPPPPTPSPVPVSPAAPRLSLDEYLRTRDGLER
jgi:hypothetical protein